MSSDGSTTGDSGMVRVMGMVVVSLLGIAVSIGLVANIIGANAEDGNDPVMRNALVKRLEPLGRVRTSADEVDVAAADAPGIAVAAAPGAEKTGDELVQGACANCHAAGVAGAPMLDDADAWAERREKGYEALVASVINGLNAMPARGGSTYTDEEIGRSVRHIAMFPEDEAPAEAAAPADPAVEATADADGVEIPETTAEAQAIPAAEAVTDPAVVAGQTAELAADPANPAPDVGDQANDMAADESSAMAGGDTNDMNADEASTGTITRRDASVAPGVAPVDNKPGEAPGLAPRGAEAGMAADGSAATQGEALADEALEREIADEVVPAAGAALTVGGPAPEGLSDRVTATVDGLCSGCHIAGVANAPKFDDAAAWQARVDKGLETLTQSVINGVGAMPPRGGSDLSDEEVPSAIQYMLSKVQ